MSGSNTHSTDLHEGLLPRSRWVRYAGSALVLTIVALAFAGYSLPDLKLQWANFVALCSPPR